MGDGRSRRRGHASIVPHGAESGFGETGPLIGPQKFRRRNPRHTLRPTPRLVQSARVPGNGGFGAIMRRFIPGGTALTRLVLGSRNKKKLREMLDLLGDLALDLTDLSPYPARPGSGRDGRHVRRQRDAQGHATRAGPERLGDRRGQRPGRARAGRRTGRLLRALRRHARRRCRQQRQAPARNGRAHGRSARRVLRQHRGAGRPDGQGGRVGGGPLPRGHRGRAARHAAASATTRCSSCRSTARPSANCRPR